MPRSEMPKVFHRDFLGAHRYTTGGGIVRPAGGVLRTTLPASQSRGGTYSSPSATLRVSTPFVYFASDDGLKGRPSSSTKSSGGYRKYRVLPQRQKGAGYGS